MLLHSGFKNKLSSVLASAFTKISSASLHTSQMSQRTLRAALIQLSVGKDRSVNVSNAERLVSKAAKEGRATIVSLPECFNSPYGIQFFKDYSESVPGGSTCQKLAQLAKDNNIYLGKTLLLWHALTIDGVHRYVYKHK